jgi:hypothetical protein
MDGAGPPKRPDEIDRLITIRLRLLFFLLLFCAATTTAQAQELEPRRWNHLPDSSNFHGAGYAYADGDLSFDPVLLIDDATVELHSVAMKYIRTFAVLGRSARIEFGGAYQDGTWKGTLDGAPAQVDRNGWADPVIRFAVNLYGAPPLEGKEYAAYRAGLATETVVGAAVAVNVPLGQYMNDKLINLGTNRFTIRPQLGVVHNRGKWGFELTGSTWLFTDNDDFFGGSKLEQKPLFAAQGHVVYHFLPTLWLGGGLAYGIGQEATVDGDDKDDRKANLVFSCSVGYAVTRHFALKVGYLGTRSFADTGIEFDSFIAGATFFWSDFW